MDPTRRDAQDRAKRTFWQGLAIDVLIAVAGTIGLALIDSDIVWTGAYWAALGTLVLKTALTATASYLTRYWVPTD